MNPIRLIGALCKLIRRRRQPLFGAIILLGTMFGVWMVVYSTQSSNGGLINRMISNMPFECHLPGYKYCGPGTNLSLRLSRGDLPRNRVDAACRKHDMSYESTNLTDRHQADQQLFQDAWQLYTTSGATWEEFFVGLFVVIAMKVKLFFGF